MFLECFRVLSLCMYGAAVICSWTYGKLDKVQHEANGSEKHEKTVVIRILFMINLINVNYSVMLSSYDAAETRSCLSMDF